VRKLLLILFILKLSFLSWSQCGTIIRPAWGDNEPDFDIPANIVELLRDSSGITLFVNPLSIHTYRDDFEVQIEIDSAYNLVYMADLRNGDKYILGKYSRYGGRKSFFSLTNCFVFFGLDTSNEPVIAVFEYGKDYVSQYDISHNVIGIDDTCIYIAPYSFRQNWRRYHKGTILSLNENGVQILEVERKRNKNDIDSILFYSNSYMVTKEFLGEFEENCYTKKKFKYKVFYHNKLIDEFQVSNSFGAFSSEFHVEGNSLVYIHGSQVRKYDSLGLVARIDSDLLESNNQFLQDCASSHKQLFVYNDIVFVKVDLNANRQIGLMSQEPSSITLNQIPIKKSSLYYSVFVMYDLHTKTLIGYPKIRFL
jgi:hypothetical protein